MATITGSNQDDTLTGTASNDIINSGNGDDTVYGDAGSDSLNGGAGNDILDGGSGSDQLNGGSGSDTLIYNVSENSTAGTKDVYTGGSGTDTVEIQFTLAQWLDSGTQTQIAAYLTHLSAVTNAKTGEVSNGAASDFVFTFGSSTLTLQMMETLTVFVDGVVQNPADVGVLALDDIGAATEDGPSVKIDVLHNDLVPDLVKVLALASGPAHGTATLIQPDINNPSSWHFQYQANSAYFQYLAEGQKATDTFTYKVTDADGDTRTATVTVTITGTNDAPVVTGTVTGNATEDRSALTLNALADSSDVDDGTTLTVVGIPGVLPAGVSYDAATHSFTLDPSHAAYQHLAAGQTAEVTVSFGVSDGIATTPESVKFTITGTNDAPVVTSNGGGAVAMLGVNENSTAVTTVTASDADDSTTQTYSIVGGTDAARFTIDATTGALSFISASNSEAPTDGNSDNVYNVTVRASDGFLFDDQAIAVSVNDVNEFAVTTPADTNAAANAVNENAAISTVVGVTAFASDADATTNAVSYSLTDNAGGKFAIDSSTGVVTVAGAIDREVNASLDITVRATSADGSATDKAFTIAVNDVNEFAVTTPADTNAAANAVDENVAIGTLVGITASASDADATTNAVSYSLSSNPGGLFAIDATTGVVTSAAAIDREALGASVTIEVTATSADTSTAVQSFSIAINDVNEFAVTTPADTNAAANAIDENAAVGTVVGVTAFASDADATTNAVSYSLTDNAGGKFAIDSSTGVVTVAGAIDREVNASLDITVRATSADGSAADQAFTIAVNDVNEFAVTTPADTNAAANAVDENAAVGTVVGVTAFASDADATTNTVSYSLTDSAGGKFAIDSSTGVVTVAGAIDREVDVSLGITVRATSADGSHADQAFTIAVNDVNEFAVTVPTDTNAAANAIDENAAVGTVVGVTAFASDADATTNAVSYSLTDSAGGKFAIDGSTGVVTVAGAIDREVNASLDITVRATSADGSAADKVFTIAVNDTNDVAPTITSGTSASEAENTVATNVVYAATATDPDTVGTVAFSLSGADASQFSINSSSGEVRFLALPNYEAPADANGDNAYQIVVHANDGVHDTTKAVTLTVSDINEAPVANSDTVITNASVGTQFLIPGAALLANDTDVDSSLASLRINGVATTFPQGVSTLGGNVTFTDSAPAGGTFNYTVTDGIATSANGLVTVNFQAGSTFAGGTANETFIGSSGNGETYQFSLTAAGGFGNDAIRDMGGNNEEIQFLTNAPTNSTVISSLNFERVGNDLVIGVNGSQLTVFDQYVAANAVSTMKFTDGGTVYGYQLNTTGYTLNIDTSIPVLDGTNSEDIIAGTSSATGETINGANKNDLLFGNLGNDTLNGGSGDDLLVAGGGADTLNGGTGNDVLVGGAGNDTFLFDSTLNAATNVDTIKDFTTGSDHIALLKAGLFANLTGSAGNSTLGNDFATSQTTAGSGAEHVFYDPSTGNLYYDASAGSHADAVVFATLSNTNGTHPTIATTDFIIG